MEIEFFDMEVLAMVQMKEEILRMIIFEVEWFWECTGQELDMELCFRKVNDQMEKNWLIYNCTDCFLEECEKAYFDIIDDLFYG